MTFRFWCTIGVSWHLFLDDGNTILHVSEPGNWPTQLPDTEFNQSPLQEVCCRRLHSGNESIPVFFKKELSHFDNLYGPITLSVANQNAHGHSFIYSPQKNVRCFAPVGFSASLSFSRTACTRK
jgi:hypothetical protein